MKLEEALKLLDDVNEGYGKVVIKSEKAGEWLVNSKYGLCYCTRDWPAPYTPTKRDFEVDDWEIKD